MPILESKEILESIESELSSAEESVRIITAFCKLNTIRRFADLVPNSVDDKSLMIRFRMDDILSGSTDFEIAEHCMSMGWVVFVRFDLHAKTYIVDNKRGIIGSANATNSGMSISGKPNLEMATLVDIDADDICKINRLFDDSILLTDNLLAKMKKELAARQPDSTSNAHWSKEIEGMFHPAIETLFAHELPDQEEYMPGDYVPFLDCFCPKERSFAAEIFRWSNAFLWLKRTLEDHDGELYFGDLSALLHNSLVEDPKPYRKDVKVMLENMLRLTENWGIDEIVIDRPRHSQRVRLL